jgi:hypothetical protein
LRQAIQEYLSMRRALGFKLHKAGKGLLDFAAFMEQRRAPYITQALALAWAQQPRNVQPAHWGTTTELRAGFCVSSQYNRSTHPDPTAGFAAFPTEESATLSILE